MTELSEERKSVLRKTFSSALRNAVRRWGIDMTIRDGIATNECELTYLMDKCDWLVDVVEIDEGEY